MRQYAKNRVLGTKFTDGNGNRIGIVTFSTRAGVECPLTSVQADLLACIDAIVYQGYTTNTALALKIAGTHLDAMSDPARRRTVEVVTDGYSNNQQATLDATSILKGKGIRILAIGISQPSSGLVGELKMMASTPVDTNAALITNFTQLDAVVNFMNGCNPSLAALPSPSPATQFSAVCTDTVVNWKDSEGFTCADYAAQQWCKGKAYGPGWDLASNRWGAFNSYTASGNTAITACCSCEAGNPTGCFASDWGAWSTCPVTCGGGSRTRSRSVTRGSCPTSQTETCNPQPCPNQPGCVMDNMLVVDASGSINAWPSDGLDWDRIVQYLRDRVNSIVYTNGSGNRTGITVFGTRAGVMCPLQFNKANLLACIGTLKYWAGWTNIADAIKVSRDHLNAMSNKSDTSRKRVIELLTDGYPTIRSSLTIPYANDAKKDNIIIAAIGVGSGVDSRQLNSIATDLNVAPLTDFKGLTGLVSQLSKSCVPKMTPEEVKASPVPPLPQTPEMPDMSPSPACMNGGSKDPPSLAAYVSQQGRCAPYDTRCGEFTPSRDKCFYEDAKRIIKRFVTDPSVCNFRDDCNTIVCDREKLEAFPDLVNGLYRSGCPVEQKTP